MITSHRDVLTPAMYSTVKTAVFDPGTPWYSLSTDYYNIQNPDMYSHAWAHLAYSLDSPPSHLGDMMLMASLSALDRANEPVNKIIRIRLGLHTVSPVSRLGSPHVDYNLPHKTALIYLTSSDGDTLVYNQKYDPNSNTDTYQYFMETYQGRVSVAATSTPEENKMICFDGMHYHSSSSPTNSAKRVTININYV
jgi:hypothetical protein